MFRGCFTLAPQENSQKGVDGSLAGLHNLVSLLLMQRRRTDAVPGG
jgi:hypothetical protein